MEEDSARISAETSTTEQLVASLEEKLRQMNTQHKEELSAAEAQIATLTETVDRLTEAELSERRTNDAATERVNVLEDAQRRDNEEIKQLRERINELEAQVADQATVESAEPT